MTNLTNVYHESKSSKRFEFKYVVFESTTLRLCKDSNIITGNSQKYRYRKITETGSAVAKYVFDFMMDVFGIC